MSATKVIQIPSAPAGNPTWGCWHMHHGSSTAETKAVVLCPECKANVEVKPSLVGKAGRTFDWVGCPRCGLKAIFELEGWPVGEPPARAKPKGKLKGGTE